MKRFLLILLLSICTNAFSPIINGRPRDGFMGGSNDGPFTEDKYLTYSEIVQKVDHFGNNSDTWRQRYQYNSKFYNKTSGYVFLMIGGEGTINSTNGDKWVKNEAITMMKWAAEYQAAVFQLEHRFYGSKEYSPFGNQKTSSLAYLTIDQALADINEFLHQMIDKYFKDDKTIWVTFGGSYPGSLSAWFRETYPMHTAGAVSTSSAVHVFVDYYGYAINTEKTYRTVSSSCADTIGDGFKNMINLAYKGPTGRQTLKEKFNLCDDFDEANVTKAVQFFMQNVYGYFQGINQYTGDNRDAATRNGLGVPGACKILDSGNYTTSIDKIVAVLDWYDSFYGGPKCRDNDYKKFVEKYSNTNMPNDDVISTRSWIYQTCTELGYFQTTDGGNRGIFGSTVPVDFFADQCIDLFGQEFTLDFTYSSVKQVRDKYGGADHYNGTNVVFPNGSFDPWQDLGHKKSIKERGIDSWLINGTAHCADMYPASPNDNPSLTAARQRIHDNLDKWLTEAQKQRTSSAINFTIFASLAILIALFI